MDLISNVQIDVFNHIKMNKMDFGVLCCLCRSVVSAGDLHCSMAASAAHITVTTARGQVQTLLPSAIIQIYWTRCLCFPLMFKGQMPQSCTRSFGLQTVSFSEETKDEINFDMLDDVAWCHIQKLTVIKSSFLNDHRSFHLQNPMKTHWLH